MDRRLAARMQKTDLKMELLGLRPGLIARRPATGGGLGLRALWGWQ
jgi:hypothetical protein